MKNLSPTKFLEVLNKGYSFDMVFLLHLIEEGWEIPSEEEKTSLLLFTLKRKLLITEDNRITLIGKELLQYVFNSQPEDRLIKKKADEQDSFSVWWSTYPSTDTFEHNGRRFIGSRSLKASKDDCRKKYNKILLEGEVNADELLNALKKEIQQKKDASVKVSSNKLSFMQNTLSYLNQRTFQSYIDLIKEEEQTKKETFNDDIQNFNGIEI